MDYLIRPDTADILRGKAVPGYIYGYGNGSDIVDHPGIFYDHIYCVENNADEVVEAKDGGREVVLSYVDGYVLPDNVEDLVLVGAFTDPSITSRGISNFSAYGNGLNNAIWGNDGDNIVYGGGGNDIIGGYGGNDTLYGGDGDDALSGDDTDGSPKGDDILYGGAGNDNLYGDGGNDKLYGGTGNDRLMTDTGKGNDLLDGGTGADFMAGGAGDDTYIVDNAGDVVEEVNWYFQGGKSYYLGTDTVKSSLAAYTLTGGVENLILTGTAIEGTGNDGDNILTGNAENNRLYGGDGNDTLDGGAGADHMEGGKGDDIYIVDGPDDVVTENAGEGTDTVRTSLESYTLAKNVENLELLGSFNLQGHGNALNNHILGNSGDNYLYGGLGNDTLTGGAGRDTFVFSTKLNAATNVDHITDFSVVDDTILLDHHIFTKLGVGALATKAFTSNTSGHATHATDRIIYDTKSGKLWYDDDGTGHHAATLIAIIDTHAKLTAADFAVF
nr:calcium-binding protein [uncultured Gellertiella sp.]